MEKKEPEINPCLFQFQNNSGKPSEQVTADCAGTSFSGEKKAQTAPGKKPAARKSNLQHTRVEALRATKSKGGELKAHKLTMSRMTPKKIRKTLYEPQLPV